MGETILENKFFSAKRVTGTAIKIAGMGGENCYLVEGSERALLIDGLCGVGSLKAFVRELTDKPVTMVATHGHIDHIGAAWEYGELFIQPDDIPLMYTKAHSGREARLGFAKFGAGPDAVHRTEPTLRDVPPAGPVKTYPVYDGDIFDLGGVQLEVIQVPGHTYGTIVLLNRAERVIFSGDACNANTLLSLQGSTSIEEYLESLHHLHEYMDAFDGMLGGHGDGLVPKSIVDDAIAMCGRIIDRTDERCRSPQLTGIRRFLQAAAERIICRSAADTPISCIGKTASTGGRIRSSRENRIFTGDGKLWRRPGKQFSFFMAG